MYMVAWLFNLCRNFLRCRHVGTKCRSDLCAERYEWCVERSGEAEQKLRRI